MATKDDFDLVEEKLVKFMSSLNQLIDAEITLANQEDTTIEISQNVKEQYKLVQEEFLEEIDYRNKEIFSNRLHKSKDEITTYQEGANGPVYQRWKIIGDSLRPIGPQTHFYEPKNVFLRGMGAYCEKSLLVLNGVATGDELKLLEGKRHELEELGRLFMSY